MSIPAPRDILSPVPAVPPPMLAPRAAAVVFIVPLIGLLGVFTLLPSLFVIVLSFFKIDILAGSYQYIGLKNFAEAYSRGEIAQSFYVTVVYITLTVPPSCVIGLLVALAISSLRRGAAFWRTIYFLPVAATLVAMAIVWRWMFMARKGIVDQTIGYWFGFEDWLNTPDLALGAVALVGNWQQIGFVTVLYCAGLLNVPRHVLEAARIDGAGPFSRFRHVIWPALGPTTVFVVVMSTIHALRVFDTVAAMTGGGPSRRTETLAYLMWERGIYYFDIGGGAVVTLVLLLLSLLLTAVQRRATARLEVAGAR